MKRLLLLCLAVPAVAHGQRAVPGQLHCIDSLAGAVWRQTPLVASVTDPAPGERNRDRYVAQLLAALPQGYLDPGADDKPATAVGFIPPDELRVPVHATLLVGILRNGRAVSAELPRPSGDPALDAALLQAARIVGGQAGLGKMPRKLRGDTVRFTVVIDDRDPPPGAVPFGARSSAYLEADTPPRIISMPPARAPRGHHGRRVVLAGTVASNGRVIAPSIRVVSSNDPVLTPIARASFAATLFRPGTRHGCRAEATIRQVFPFP